MVNQKEPTQDKKEERRSKDYIDPPEEFVQDVEKASDKEIKEVSRLCGISRASAKMLLNRVQLPRIYLDEAQRNFYHRQEGSLRVRMLNILKGPISLKWSMLRRLRAVAEMVEKYRDTMYLNTQQSYFYLFPPRDMVRKVASTLNMCYGQLQQLHQECPEFDKLIFRNAPKLLKELIEVEKHGKRNSVYKPHVYKMSGSKSKRRGSTEEQANPDNNEEPGQP